MKQAVIFFCAFAVLSGVYADVSDSASVPSSLSNSSLPNSTNSSNIITSIKDEAAKLEGEATKIKDKISTGISNAESYVAAKLKDALADVVDEDNTASDEASPASDSDSDPDSTSDSSDSDTDFTTDNSDSDSNASKGFYNLFL